jgi:hypothetical protein
MGDSYIHLQNFDMNSATVPYNHQDSTLTPLPAVSQDLWLEATDGKARKALRAVSDGVGVLTDPYQHSNVKQAHYH